MGTRYGFGLDWPSRGIALVTNRPVNSTVFRDVPSNHRLRDDEQTFRSMPESKSTDRILRHLKRGPKPARSLDDGSTRFALAPTVRGSTAALFALR